MDSMLVYRGLDVGTAKPDAAARARVPHHLLDVDVPDEQYNAGRFAKEARAAARASSEASVPVRSSCLRNSGD